MARLLLLALVLAPLASGAQTFTETPGLPTLPTGAVAPALVDVDGDGRTDILLGVSILRQTDSGFEFSRFDQNGGFAVLIADWERGGAREAALITPNTPIPFVWNRARGEYRRLAGTGMETVNVPLIQGSVFLDDDRDGRLDFLVGNDGGADVLLRQRPDGAFEDVSASVLPGTPGGTYGMAAADFDRDGDLDVAIGLCDPLPAENLFYLRGDTAFTEVAASNRTDDPLASWGVAWLDYDGDGWLDLFVANMPRTEGATSYPGFNSLFRNRGDGTFAEVGEAANVRGESTVDSWSAVAADFDNDGWIDIAVGNQEFSGSAEPWTLHRNNGDGTFSDITAGSGLGAFQSTNIGAADVDGDGWVDLVSLDRTSGARPVLFRNDGGTNAWLAVRLRGLASNTDGIGARVEVASGGRTQVREISAGDGFMGQSHELEAHVGLGTETTADVTVRWPSGQVDVVTGVSADQRITIVEGEGRNDAPEAFALAAPASGAQLASTDPATFSWEEAADDGPVTYSLLIEHDDGEARTYTTEATSFTVPAGDLVPGVSRWAVVASDGRSERTSQESRAFSFVVVDATEETPEAGPALTLGPNPASDVLRVQVSEPGTLTVLDARGRRVLTERVASGEAVLDLRALPPGAYTVRVESQSGTSTAPFVVTR